MPRVWHKEKQDENPCRLEESSRDGPDRKEQYNQTTLSLFSHRHHTSQAISMGSQNPPTMNSRLGSNTTSLPQKALVIMQRPNDSRDTNGQVAQARTTLPLGNRLTRLKHARAQVRHTQSIKPSAPSTRPEPWYPCPPSQQPPEPPPPSH